MRKKRKTSPKNTASPRGQSLAGKMKLLGFVRGKDAFLELMTEMQHVETALAESHRQVHALTAGSEEEADCIARIRELENRRFQLLSEVHGNRVQDYHLLQGS